MVDGDALLAAAVAVSDVVAVPVVCEARPAIAEDDDEFESDKEFELDLLLVSHADDWKGVPCVLPTMILLWFS